MFKTFMIGLSALCMVPLATVAEQPQWSLEGVSEQLWQLSAERKIVESAIIAAQAKKQSAARWSNPELELAVDNAIGKEVGSGDSDLSQITIRQAIPLTGRLETRKQQASTQLDATSLQQQVIQLQLQKEASSLYHGLQYQQMRMALLQQQLESTAEFQRIAQRREQGGDISRLERLRLELINETSRQQINVAEGELHEAESALQNRLHRAEPIPELPPLVSVPPRPVLATLEPYLEMHPELQQLKKQVTTDELEINLQKAQRINDPQLWLSYERSYINGERQGVSGAGIAFTLPLWDRKQGEIASARQTMHQTRYRLEARERQLRQKLALHHRHLGHLIEQVERHRKVMLAPAQEVFNLSREAFAVGQADILQLVDAVDTYFQTELEQLSLMHSAWLEWSELRYTAAIQLATPLPSEKGNE